VEHSVPQPELVRPWRTATLVATAIAGLELVLLIVAGIVLLGKSLAPRVHAAAQHRALAPKAAATKPPPAAAKTRRPPHVVAKLSRAQTKVFVLNGNGVQGAAAEAASLVEARGYRVKEVANAPHSGYAKTIVMYRPGFAGEAKRFARDLNLGLVEPLDGMKPAQLHGAQIVVILGAAR
jgi:hypothetical protein